jgi:hypothetical protein
VKEQLEKLVLQMYRSGIRYSEAIREFQSAFILTVLQEHKANQVRAAQKLGITATPCVASFGISNLTSGSYVRRPVAHRSASEQFR